MIFFYTNPILIAAAVIPAVFLLVHVYRADKLEKEPAPLLISLVLYGIAATFIALLLERFGSWLLGRYFPENSTPYNVLMYFGVVAFSEEGAKYFLLKRRTWNSAAFNCQFDGVVYAVFVSLGFALWENISYVLMYGLSTALVRAVTAVPGHACFGVFMGVWYGLAKRLHGQGKDGASKLCRVLALLLPAFQQVHCQQHHRRDNDIHQHPPHGTGLIVGAPELVHRGGDGGRLARGVARYHAGSTVLAQGPGKGQHRTGQNALSAAGHPHPPEYPRIGLSQCLGRPGQRLVKALEGSPGSAVHQREGHHDGRKDGAVPVNDQLDAEML